MTFFANILNRNQQFVLGALFLSMLSTPNAFAIATVRCEAFLVVSEKVSQPPRSQKLVDKSQFETLTKSIGKISVGGHNISELLAQDAGVNEGYSVQQHIDRVFDAYTSVRDGNLTRLSSQLQKSPAELDQFLSVLIVLHDIGKPLAAKAGDTSRQHEFTVPLMREALTRMRWSAKDIELAEALAGNDLIGHYIQGASDVYSTLTQISATSNKLQVDLNTFLQLQILFYKSDAGSYPFLKGLLFLSSPSGNFDFKPGRMELLTQLAERKDLEKVLVAAKSPEKIQKLRLQWMKRQEKLFEHLFDKLNLGSYATFEQRLLRHVENLKDFFPKSTLTERDLHKLRRIEDLHDENLEVRIRTSSKFLKSILTEGYKNRSEGGAGSLQSGFSGDVQDLVEASFLGASPKDVAAMPAELRVRFGFLAPSPKAKTVMGTPVTGFTFKDGAPDHHHAYNRILEIGDLTIILDPKDYHEALTLTAGDSANTLQKTEKAALPNDMKYHKPEAWDQVYIPWKYRMALHKGLKSQNYNWAPGGGSFEFSLDRNPDLLSEEVALNKMPKTFVTSGLGPEAEYFEVQIWKPIRKILAVEVGRKQNLPEDIKKLLESLGIEIRISPIDLFRDYSFHS